MYGSDEFCWLLIFIQDIPQSTEFSTLDLIYYIILEGKSKCDDRDILVFMLLDEQGEEWGRDEEW